ncbi:alpha/beta fold hydrolase [Mycolicibacterium vaccae]|uniref:alpha/beta fold hydrolase n=1 Tax=Mycolicibacterium vaccae TaxID=1810 RepID=UPI003CE99B10
MAVELHGVTAVLLPGTGSDDDFVYRAFAGPLHAAGAVVVTPRPQPRRLIAGYRDALADAARSGRIVVGGVSIGAAVALEWALSHQAQAVAVLAALPAWSGSPESAPAAHAARYSAEALRRDGLAVTTAQMQASSPPWLAEELTRSWAGQWPALPDAMEQAAAYTAPTTERIAALEVPLAVVSATDDAVHPLQVGVEWASVAPRAVLRTVTLEQIGADPAVLGAQCLTGLAGLDGGASA